MLLEVCEQCDVKGFYVRVWCGEIKNFIGIDFDYEFFENLELVLDIF